MDISEKIINIWRFLHQYPELGNEEYKTTKFIDRILKSVKIKTKHITKTGVIGILENRKSKKCIALRADIDALPVKEQSDLPKKYQSKHYGVMHACGHDANTSMVLGAAVILSQQNNIDATVKFIFQPNEETANGAKQLIDRGVLKNPDIDAIIGIHVNPELHSGVIGLKYGEILAQVDRFSIELFGGGGHSAYPHKGKDLIFISSEIIQSLQSIITRQINPVEPVVISIGKIEGGTAFNVLADSIRMLGTVRTLNENLHKDVVLLMKKHISNIAKKYNIQYKFKYEVVGYPVFNNKKMIDLCLDSAKKITNTVILDKPSMGGEDFAEYLRYVPGCFIYIGTKKKKSIFYSWHHPKFKIDPDILYTGSKVLAKIVKDFCYV